MTYDARAIANFFIDQADLEQQIISHLKIQKLLYFSHAWHLAKFNSKLIGQPFEAWDYGPVVRVVYDQLKKFKAKPVTSRLQKIDTKNGNFIDAYDNYTDHQRDLLIAIYKYYGRFNALKLSDITHEKNGPWDITWGKAKNSSVAGMVIPNDLIRSWFENKTNHSDWEDAGRSVH